MKPLYGLSTTCKDRYKTIRNFLSDECGGKVTSLDKSVFFWAQRGFDYVFGKELRDKNSMNSDQGNFKINEFPETNER